MKNKILYLIFLLFLLILPSCDHDDETAPDQYIEVSRIVIIDIATSEMTELTSGYDYCILPIFTPDGQKIIYAQGVSKLGNNHGDQVNKIYIMNIDGTGKQLLAQVNGTLSVFTGRILISPDGNKVYIADDQDMYSVNIDGTGLTNITNTPSYPEKHPYLSRDGNWLLYSSEGKIIRRNTVTNEVFEIVRGSTYSYIDYPVFTSDNNSVVFYQDGAILKIDIDGTNEMVIDSCMIPSPSNIDISIEDLVVYIKENEGMQIYNLVDSTKLSFISGAMPSFSTDGQYIVFTGVNLRNKNGTGGKYFPLTKTETYWQYHPKINNNNTKIVLSFTYEILYK